MLNDGKTFSSIAAVRLVLEGRGKKNWTQLNEMNKIGEKNFKILSRGRKTAKKNRFFRIFRGILCFPGSAIAKVFLKKNSASNGTKIRSVRCSCRPLAMFRTDRQTPRVFDHFLEKKKFFLRFFLNIYSCADQKRL